MRIRRDTRHKRNPPEAPFTSLTATKELYELVMEAREAEGRPPIMLFAVEMITAGRTAYDARRQSEKIGRKPPLHGTPDQVVDLIGQYAELGTTRFYLQILDLSDLDYLDVIAAEITPQLS
jgi:alkanesulfonate monooxygenase SsuD/methylene tetrahydromethanopterin reductase-like flavin-dependent oxidoreductase (luciferase family)